MTTPALSVDDRADEYALSCQTLLTDCDGQPVQRQRGPGLPVRRQVFPRTSTHVVERRAAGFPRGPSPCVSPLNVRENHAGA